MNPFATSGVVPFALTSLNNQNNPNNFIPPATDLFLRVDSDQTANRFGVRDLQVTFDSPFIAVPEPTSASILGLCTIALLSRRKRS